MAGFSELWEDFKQFILDARETRIPNEKGYETHRHDRELILYGLLILITTTSFFSEGFWGVLFSTIVGIGLCAVFLEAHTDKWSLFSIRATSDREAIVSLRAELAKASEHENDVAGEAQSLLKQEHEQAIQKLKDSHAKNQKTLKSKIQKLQTESDLRVSELELPTLFQAVRLRLENTEVLDDASMDDLALMYAQMQEHIPNMARVDELASVSHEIMRARGVQTIVKYYSNLIVEAENNDEFSEDEKSDTINAYRMARESELQSFHSGA